MKQKITAIYYDDEFNPEDYMYTWLSLELEDWRIIKHYTTDVVKPFNYEKK